MLDELRTVAPTISTYDDWTRQLLAQGEQALAGGRALAGAYLIRTAEFFMTAGDPRQDIARDTFVNEVLAAYNIGPDHHHRVPYEGRQLSAYRLAPTGLAGGSWYSAASTATSRSGCPSWSPCAPRASTLSPSTVLARAPHSRTAYP